jgi:hypothetical protein
MPCLCVGNAQSHAQVFKLSDYQGISVSGLPEDVLFLHEYGAYQCIHRFAIRIRKADTSVSLNTLPSSKIGDVKVRINEKGLTH